MSEITIWHNPKCGTSRNVLALIRNAGVEPVVRLYLEDPPNEAEIRDALSQMGIPLRDWLRRKGTPFDELGLDDPALGEADLIAAMLAHPILINRPVVFTDKGVRLCRPSETVLDLLPPQQGAFAKEDGEQVVGQDGKPV